MMLLVAIALSATPWMHDAGVREAKIAEARALPLNERVLNLSSGFLGTPYGESPLGEGAGRDTDPLIRYDKVDCLTFVEEVLAMSLAPDESARVDWLNRIRYFAEPAWEHRNHVMEAQWIPKNIERGFLSDVTATYGQTVPVTKTLTAPMWSEGKGKPFALPTPLQPVGTFSWNVLPATSALNSLERAPSGTLVVIVRADRPKEVTRISHIGILLQTPKGPVLRHASRSFKRVVDEPLEHYLSRNLNFGAWTVAGVQLLQVRTPEK